MKSTFKIREAVVSDAAEILEIYKPIVEDSITSFEFEVPTKEEMERRIESTLPNFPWLVSEASDGSVAGYAYGSKHRDREGYQWIAETGIYISSKYQGHGVGTKLYINLCKILKKQGYVHALAIIAGDNRGSIGFHIKHGFDHVGGWKNCGNKFGKWCDVFWYSKQLSILVENPEKPLPYSEIKNEVDLES